MGVGGLDLVELQTLFRALQRHQVEYVVVGAIAMALQGVTRATEDVDLFVRPTDANVTRLRAALQEVWHDPLIEEIQAAELAGEIGVVTYVPPVGEWHLDVISHLPEAFRFEDIEHQPLQLEHDLVVPVATPRMLYRMKRDTIRHKDRIDAAWLQERFRLEGD